MKQLEPLILVQSTPGMVTNIGSKMTINANNEMAPLFSFAQEERLDAFLAKLKRTYESNQINDITTSAVMELYEYKVYFFNIFYYKHKIILYFLYFYNIKVSSYETCRTGYAI